MIKLQLYPTKYLLTLNSLGVPNLETHSLSAHGALLLSFPSYSFHFYVSLQNIHIQSSEFVGNSQSGITIHLHLDVTEISFRVPVLWFHQYSLNTNFLLDFIVLKLNVHQSVKSNNT